MALIRRLVPDTLFGRLALLLLGFVLVSHVLALTMMFELMPPPPPPPGPPDGAGFGASPPGRPPLLQAGMLLDIGVRLSALMLAAWIAARWVAQPMKRLSAAAHELARNASGSARPLPELGVREWRDATRMFNDMQAQIRRQIDERNRFVAAVSHDLRTPLTRLRLRAEGLDEPAARRQFCRDIGEMDLMIHATLDYLRGAAQAEARVPLDVQALAESIAEDQRAAGHDVQVYGRAEPLPAQPSALQRCLCNLVDNAVRYAGAAEIGLHDDGQALVVEVRDRGPGIPADQIDRVLEPFYRVEGSRNRQHGGVGLGLSIARDTALQHGGTLALRNREHGGLVATLRLPRQGPGAT
jgi:signal transduction histidine kinase